MLDFDDICLPKNKKEARSRFYHIVRFFPRDTSQSLNILGISRQIDLSFTIAGTRIPFIVFVGVLPYPLTFSWRTDFISELYGKKRANTVVWVGLSFEPLGFGCPLRKTGKR